LFLSDSYSNLAEVCIYTNSIEPVISHTCFYSPILPACYACPLPQAGCSCSQRSPLIRHPVFALPLFFYYLNFLHLVPRTGSISHQFDYKRPFHTRYNRHPIPTIGMQFSKATLVAVLAALIQAQSISDLVAQIPSCAVSCLTTAIGDSGCALTDYVCQCTNPGHNTILAKGAGCISAACSTSDTLSMSTSPMIIHPVEKMPNCG
jgi:hypothetical protein